MKIFLPFIVGVLLLSYPLAAQEIENPEVDQAAEEVEETIDEVADYVESNVDFGGKVGFNFSTLNSSETFNADTKTGLHFGLFGRYLWSERISGKVELLYTTMGARADEFYLFDDYSINLNYAQLVASGEIEVVDGFRLELGPYLGVLLSSRQSFQDIDENREGERAGSDDTNFVDVGFVVGSTYTFPSGFGLGLRYQQGFADALGNDFFRNASGSNAAWQLSTHFAF